MTVSNDCNLNKPGFNYPLQEILREGARKILTAAIESGVTVFLLTTCRRKN
ncbi:MAG: hypothetical protein H6936_15275 [Burkholderiales bacterium]|nr:hypothetical protein [Nitrosomonas sp.]MCP5276172.1 hypothetical protein [Burkholderiales bacterium]